MTDRITPEELAELRQRMEREVPLGYAMDVIRVLPELLDAYESQQSWIAWLTQELGEPVGGVVDQDAHWVAEAFRGWPERDRLRAALTEAREAIAMFRRAQADAWERGYSCADVDSERGWPKSQNPYVSKKFEPGDPCAELARVVADRSRLEAESQTLSHNLCSAYDDRDRLRAELAEARNRIDMIRALATDQLRMHRANGDGLDVCGRVESILHECRHGEHDKESR